MSSNLKKNGRLSSIQSLMILIGIFGGEIITITPSLAEIEPRINATEQIVQAEEVPPTPNPDEAQTEPTEAETPATNSAQTLAQIATETEQLSTFMAALKAAELQDMVAQQGPYTIFAPTDAAFKQLPEGTLDKLLNPENQELLKQLLMYHIVSNKLMLEDLQTGTVETLSGGLAIQESEFGTIINDATIVKENMEASNGVIHLVNRVLIPENFGESLGLNSEPSENQPSKPTSESSENQPSAPSGNQPSAPSENQPSAPSENQPLEPSGNQPSAPSESLNQ